MGMWEAFFTTLNPEIADDKEEEKSITKGGVVGGELGSWSRWARGNLPVTQLMD